MITSFSIEKRTITGVLMPVNGVAQKGGHYWRFAKGAVSLADAAPVNLYHDRKQRVGKRVASETTDQGLIATFSIDEGEAGDRALQDAADGLLSFSIEISNPEFRDAGGARMVTKVVADEVGLTPVPAFGGAGVTSVVFSAEGVEPEETPVVAPAAPVVQFDSEGLAKALAEALKPAIAAGRPVTPVGRLEVSEEAPYRFDGIRGQHDFSTDLFAGLKNRGGEQYDRAMGFIRENFAVVQSNVDEVNPTKQRPDMYVDQLDYQFPLWNAVRKGSLSDNTPFVFPKFSASSGLVANHTEGVEPTPGAFSTTNQTVTPSAVSGKVEITREVWDQGGNPQVSGLIWRQMNRAYYEALEAYVVAGLEAAAASITDIALTTAGADKALSKELAQKFVALQYIRGGFRFDNLAVQIDLYNALASAVDDNGRPLFPMLSPSNANGTVAPRFSSLNVHGVSAFPSWALAATGTVSANSWLFDSGAVHAWASAPERLDFQYRVAYVDLAIWGYKAFAISDNTGVRQVTYDPTV